MPLIKSGAPAVALIRALGVTDVANVRRVTLNMEAGQLAVLEVERYVDSSCITAVEQLQLRTEPYQHETLGSGAGQRP
jgi:hypothetical protein